MSSLGIGVLAGLLVALLGAIGKRFVDATRRRQRLGHLYSLISGVDRVQIIVPSLDAPVFIPQGTSEVANVPGNVKVIPMAEGIAIAELVSALRRLRVREVQLLSQENYQDNAGLTISVGGPSLNSVSGTLLGRSFPRFSIKYPEHVASYGTTTFSPRVGPTGELVEDYGFVAAGRTSGGNRSVVLCGVWAFGTQIATNTLLRLPPQSEARHLLSRNRNFFLVSHAPVDGLWPGSAEVVEIRREGAPSEVGKT